MKLALAFNAAVGLGTGLITGAVAMTIGAPLTAVGTAALTAAVAAGAISAGAGFICSKAFDGKGASAGIAGLFFLAASNMIALPVGIVAGTATVAKVTEPQIASSMVSNAKSLS